jgi:Inositol-pentakisphosphate 2-kinase
MFHNGVNVNANCDSDPVTAFNNAYMAVFPESTLELAEVLTRIIMKTPLISMLKKHTQALHYDVKAIYDILEISDEAEIDTMMHRDVESILDIYESTPTHSLDSQHNILLFLLGMTLKDLSVMVVISRKPGEDTYPVDGCDLYFRLKLVDVDPKPCKNIHKNLELEMQVRDVHQTRVCRV